MKKQQTKKINGMEYKMTAKWLGVTNVTIYAGKARGEVFNKFYPHTSIDKAMKQAWRDFDLVRANIIVNRKRG